MRCLGTLALAVVLCNVTQPLLRATDSQTTQEEAIAAIKKLGGTVEVDVNRPDQPVVSVNLKRTQVMDASLEHLKGLSKLQVLVLKETQVTDGGIVYLKGLTNIEALELGKTKVTDKGLEHLKGFTRLRNLDLAGTHVTDSGLEHLKELRQLQTLDVSGTNVTQAGIDGLQKALPKLRIVH